MSIEPVRQILVVGAGGHARELHGAIISAGNSCIGLLDDSNTDSQVLSRIGATLLGKTSLLAEAPAPDGYLIGIGSGHIRKLIAEKYPETRAADPLIHPSAELNQDIRIANGAVIFALATVTTNITIGKHTHIGRSAAIGHDVVLGNYVTVMPLASISGAVHIGDCATIGSGAVIRQGQRIGAGAFVGAGAVVVEDVQEGETVVGNPARRIKRR